MSATYEDTYFEYLKNEYDFLEFLTIGHVYPLFYSEHIDMDDSFSYCDSLPTAKYTDVFDYRSFCKKTDNLLSYLNKMIRAQSLYNNTKWCEYLSYYIYEIISKCTSCKDTEQLYTQLKKIIRYYYPLYNNCTIQKFTIGIEDFMKKKKLYLLGEILFWIKNEYENSDYLNDHLYDTFFGECSKIYDQILTEDSCKLNENYKTELINLKDNFNSAKAYLNRKNKGISHSDLQSPDASMCQNKVQVGKEVQAGTEKELEGPGKTEEEESEIREEPSKGEITRDTGLAEGMPMEASAALRHTDYDLEDITEDSPNRNIPKPVGTIVGTSLGFVLPLITLYKFTPFGTWIDTKILRRNNVMNNIKNNKQDFLLNSSENREMKLGHTMYRVTYNSVTN